VEEVLLLEVSKESTGVVSKEMLFPNTEDFIGEPVHTHIGEHKEGKGIFPSMLSSPSYSICSKGKMEGVAKVVEHLASKHEALSSKLH
jgi:hypothetical protein